MLSAVFFVAGSAALSPWVLPARAAPCAIAITRAAVAHGASLEDALLEAAWAGRESGCNPHAVSTDGLDVGLLQLRGWARRGHSAAELLEDPVLCARVWLEDLDELRGICGTTKRALGALATGKCGGAPRLVARRLDLAGVDAEGGIR